jgi:GntR family transcriptional regulator, transcriptional repressor for pyruvate dehydrogenase complex
MDFELVGRPARLPIEISRRIEEAIRIGRYKPGERLPTEAALASSFGVSRNVVREAIARLRSDGLVRSRQGLGAFVEELRQEIGFRIAPDSLGEPVALRHLYELRLEVEAGAAALAAIRHSKKELDRIAAALDLLAEALERDELGVEANFAFHRAIAQAARNPYFCDLLDYLATQIGRGVALVRRSPGEDRRTIRDVHGEHTAIFEAISARDPIAAGKAMRVHLTQTAARIGLRIGHAVST